MRWIILILTIPILVNFGCSDEYRPTAPSLPSSIDTLVVEPEVDSLVAYADVDPQRGEIPLPVNMRGLVYGGLPPYHFEWYVNGSLIDTTRIIDWFKITEVGTHTVIFTVSDAQGVVSSDTTLVTAYEPAKPDTLNWCISTDLAVGDSKSTDHETLYPTQEGEHHLWFLFKFDARNHYTMWIIFKYEDGSQKQFPVADLYSDRPTTILFDMGMAKVEERLDVTLKIENPSNSGGTLQTILCNGWNRLLEIHGSKIVPVTKTPYDKIIKVLSKDNTFRFQEVE